MKIYTRQCTRTRTDKGRGGEELSMRRSLLSSYLLLKPQRKTSCRGVTQVMLR
jgi:hypothetical protein